MAKMENTSFPAPPNNKILIIKPPTVFIYYENHFSRYFHFLKAYESPLPLPSFLAAANATDVSVLFVTANGPQITGPAVLDHVPSLKCIVSSAKGVDYIDLDECRRRGISVANAGDVSSSDCADFAVGLLLDVLRKVSAGDRFVRCGGWSVATGEFALGRRLAGKTVGIVGLGSIGSKIARRLQSFGCRVLYNSRKKKPSVHYPFYSDVCEMATNSDVLVISCSLSDQTKHMIDKQVLTALGKDGVVINIARGAIVDEEELVRFLQEGQIAGAGLDVYEHAPSVPKELFGMDNVVLTHHQAVFTEECHSNLYELVKGNFQAFFSNDPLLTPVV